MSRCPYCRCEVAGFQTLCQRCWEKYGGTGPAKPWLPKGLPRLARDNILAFLFVFAFGSLVFRFDPPLFHYPSSTKVAGLIALLFAFIAVYLKGKR